MKKQYIFAALACVIGIALIFLLSTSTDAKPLSVSDVVADPSAFNGTITITGVMGGISELDKSVFGIMDVKELQCKSQNCNKVFIPIKFQGQMPMLGDEVRVDGSFVKVADGYLFSAKKIKVLRNHKIGA